MRAPRLLAICSLLSVVCLPLLAQQGGYVEPRITQPVNERQLTVLRGNTHPLARTQYDRGAAPSDLRMDRMLLVLKRSPEQETALLKLLDDQQDKGTPNYHKWVTPEQFGQTFGPADADMQAITSWLISHGFQIGNVSKGRTVIEFSGTASQVQQAFHTAIHKYVVDGEEHWANGSDLQIPAALAPVVAGVHTLHNFRKQPAGKFEATRVSATLGKDGVPQVNLSDGSHALVPGDLQTIYNARPLLNVGKNGNTETIAVVGRSNVFNFGQDVSDFRGIFGGAGAPFFITLNGPDPGDLGGGEEGEATLDLTWAAALAPGATVNFVASAGTNTTDGVDLSALFIVDNNLAGIMTESFSICEIALGTTELQSISSLAEQAAAQGITYMVSSGDSGAAGCDSASSSSAQFGKAVNALAATPFTVAVGGTMFNENGHNGTYWNTNNSQTDFSSAKSYIPENVWNESGPTLGLWSSGGGVSTFFNKPVWQSGVGVPPDGKRDVPDVSLTAAGHDAFILCIEGSCVPDQQTGQFFIFLVSGTSASAPSFAGVMALVDQAMSARQGQANYVMYKLAQGETLSQCNGSSTSGLPNASCIFNDVTVGNNSVPGLTGFNAGVGYDLATGLGSVNINNLVNDWASATFSGTTTALTLNSGNPVNVTHGTAVDVHIVVTPNGSGTPTGDVSLWGPNDAGLTFFTLSGGSVTTSTRLLPGGTYTAKSHYQGDATFSQSESSPVAVTVNPENSTTTMQALSFGPDGNLHPFSSVPAGALVYLRTDVAGQSGFGTATGSVAFTDNGTDTIAGSPFVLNSEGNTATPNGITTLAAGAHSIVAGYSGDGSFHPSTSIAVTFTVTDFSLSFGSPTITVPQPGGSGSTDITVSTIGGFGETIHFSCSGLPRESTCAFNPPTVDGAGTTTLTVSTTASHSVMLRGFGRTTTRLAMVLFGVLLFIPRSMKQRWPLLLGLLLLVLIVLPACGGGSSSGGGSSKDPGTPSGDSTVTVTALSSDISHTGTFTLHVQ